MNILKIKLIIKPKINILIAKYLWIFDKLKLEIIKLKLKIIFLNINIVIIINIIQKFINLSS